MITSIVALLFADSDGSMMKSNVGGASRVGARRPETPALYPVGRLRACAGLDLTPMPCESAAVRICSLGAWPRPPGRRQLDGVHPLARRLEALAPKPLEITPPCGGPDQRRLLKPEGTLSNGEAHGELTSAGMRCARDLGAES